MTTAARPTFEPAKGGMDRGERDLSALSKQYSSRDLPSHNRLKYREHGQNTSEEVRSRDFRRELDDRERSAAEKRSSGARGTQSRSEFSSSSSKKSRMEAITPANLDADDAQDNDDSDSDDDSEDESALYAELERIRRERADELATKKKEQADQEERIRMENIISGNPLLSLGAAHNKQLVDLKVKKRWDDDVVFKNCAASEAEKKEKIFLNDSLRSEFHKRFMEKYIK